MKNYLLKEIALVNEGKITECDILIKNGRFERIDPVISPPSFAHIEVRGNNRFLLPGIIDTHVHFREPGLTHKATIYSDSRAALFGGVTSFMEMPNTKPPATTLEELSYKYHLASKNAAINYAFYLGATNDNLETLKKATTANTCGIKVFMGSSTGNMLVDDPDTLESIFSSVELPVVVHAEEESIISANLAQLQNNLPEPWPFNVHAEIRNHEGCYVSSKKAVDLAKKHGTRLHVLHLTTADEIHLFSDKTPLKDKKITAEVCPHHLYFDDNDYEKYGGRIKCNPAIKTAQDKEALLQALLSGSIDMVNSDHAPHTLSEKQNPYNSCPSGMPIVQESLLVMLEFYKENRISLPQIAEKMAHNQATVFNIPLRGFVREGYYADAALLNLDQNTTLHQNKIRTKCGWSPFEGHTFPGRIDQVFVNGTLALDGEELTEEQSAKPLY